MASMCLLACMTKPPALSCPSGCGLQVSSHCSPDSALWVDLLTGPPNLSLVWSSASFVWHLVRSVCGGSGVLGPCVCVMCLVPVAAVVRAQQ